MQKSTIRNIIAAIAIIISYITLIIIQRDNFTVGGSDNLLIFAMWFGIISLIGGMIGGIIAPYTFKKAVLYVEIMLIVPAIVGGIILIMMGSVFGENQNSLAGVFIFIIILIFAVALAVFLVVTAIGIYAGAWVGSKIGKGFTSDYRLKDERTHDESAPQLGFN